MNQPPTVISEEAREACRQMHMEGREHIVQLAIDKATEKLREEVKQAWHDGFHDGKAGEYGVDFAWNTSRAKEILNKVDRWGEQRRKLEQLQAENAKLKEDLQVVEHNSMASGQAGSMVQAHLREQLSQWQECARELKELLPTPSGECFCVPLQNYTCESCSQIKALSLYSKLSTPQTTEARK